MKRCLTCNAAFESSGWQCPKCGFCPTCRGGILRFAPDLADASKGYNPAWYEELVRLEGRHFWFRARNRLIAWLARRHIPSNAAFLEIGCGTGYVLQMLRQEFPHWRIIASEVLAHAFSFAARRVDSSVQFQQIDARSLPYRSEFDAIGAFDVIEHIEEDALVLSEIHAALKPDGLLVASVPQHAFLWSRYDEIGRHYRRYATGGLNAALARAGFRMVESTSFNALLLPVLWLSRFARKMEHEDDVLDELRIGSVPNAVLSLVLALEFALVRMGVRWPAGASRIFVAQRISPAQSHAIR